MRRLAKKVNIKKLEKSIDYRFKKKANLLAALTHPSYRYETEVPKMDDFDRLEFFGDTILNFLICKKLYTQFPQASEGTLSKLRATLVSKKILSRIAKRMRLAQFVILGKSLSSQPINNQTKILSDFLEAIIAAIYLDGGIKAAEKFILSHFEPFLNWRSLSRLGANPKSNLQEICQKLYKVLPDYRTVHKNNAFVSRVRIKNIASASGDGINKRDAEEAAARKLIAKLKAKKR